MPVNAPNTNFRLKIDLKFCKQIDPEIPAELIFDDYKFLIGTSSSSIAFFDQVSISIIDFFNDKYSSIKTRKHLEGIDKIKNILYPKNNNELINCLKNY